MKIERKLHTGRYRTLFNLTFLAVFVFASEVFKEHQLTVNTLFYIVFLGFLYYDNYYLQLTKKELISIKKHAQISFTNNYKEESNLSTIGWWLVTTLLLYIMFRDDLKTFFTIEFFTIIVFAIGYVFERKEQFIITEEQFFLITPHRHELMNIADIVRVTGDKKKIEFVSIEERLAISFKQWDEREKNRLYAHLEQKLAIDIPRI